ncbi:MAG: response regulator, partial [Gammaproteobacteria bacterium]
MMRREIQSGTVLVADDNEGYRSLFRDLLEEHGYKVICASDGDEALDSFARLNFDVALLDVMMPRRTGFSVCRAVKADVRTRLVPVVLVTGLNNVEDRVQGIECGADDFLSKPINEQELLARVRSLVRLKQFTDELECSETVLFTLARSIEAKDPYTEGHCERLSKYSVALARRLSL